MESRPDLYYEGNTVIPPHPGRKRKMRTMNQEGYVHENKTMPFVPKVCATSSCLWCNKNFGGRYMVVCLACRNCQYCGLLSPTSLKACRLCGNSLPEELNVGGERIVAAPPE